MSPTPSSSYASQPVHAERMPWIPMTSPGLSFKPLRFFKDDAGWMYLFRLEPGTVIPPHRHTGESHAFNLSGSRELLDTGEVIGPGGYVYEPAGNVDSWRVTGPEPLVLLIHTRGGVEYLTADGQVSRHVAPADRLESYRQWCEANGQPFLATLE